MIRMIKCFAVRDVTKRKRSFTDANGASGNLLRDLNVLAMGIKNVKFAKANAHLQSRDAR
jgi:hypothetical protein